MANATNILLTAYYENLNDVAIVDDDVIVSNYCMFWLTQLIHCQRRH